MDYFNAGSTKTAVVKPTVSPSGIACEIEVWLGPDVNTKSATSGKIAFTSTGTAQNVSVPIVMPATEDSYHVYVGIYIGSLYYINYSENDVTVIGNDWMPGWTNRLKFSTNYTLISSPLTDFPVLLNIYHWQKIFTEIGANSKKLAITSSDGIIQCPVEISEWDSKTKNAAIFFKAPYLYSSKDTVFYIYYDKAHADNTNMVGLTGEQAAWDVWDDNFVAVYHLVEKGVGALKEYRDSTRQQHHGTGGVHWHNGVTAANATAGTASKCPAKQLWGQKFDGVDDLIGIPDHADFSIPTTGYLGVSCWINPWNLDFPSPSPGSIDYTRWMGKHNWDQTEWDFRIYNNYNYVPQANPHQGNHGVIAYAYELGGGHGIGCGVSWYEWFLVDTWNRFEWCVTPDVPPTHALFAYGNTCTTEPYQGSSNTGGYKSISFAWDDHPNDITVVPEKGSSPISIGSGSTKDDYGLAEYAPVILAEIRYSNIKRSAAWRVASYYAESDQLVKYG